MINWQTFDWPSFATLIGALATLIVGVAAVYGAFKVGVKQAGNADRQADIMSRQVALAEASLKAELFDRRLGTYEIAADFVLHLSDLGDSEEGKARFAHYAAKMRESQFLFRPEVYSALVEIWEAGNRLRVARATSISRHEEGLPRDINLGTTIDELVQWSMRRIETLYEVFSADLEVTSDLLSSHSSGRDMRLPPRRDAPPPIYQVRHPTCLKLWLRIGQLEVQRHFLARPTER